jgi:hypothetical protein
VLPGDCCSLSCNEESSRSLWVEAVTFVILLHKLLRKVGRTLGMEGVEERAVLLVEAPFQCSVDRF